MDKLITELFETDDPERGGSLLDQIKAAVQNRPTYWIMELTEAVQQATAKREQAEQVVTQARRVAHVLVWTKQDPQKILEAKAAAFDRDTDWSRWLSIETELQEALQAAYAMTTPARGAVL